MPPHTRDYDTSRARWSWADKGRCTSTQTSLFSVLFRYFIAVISEFMPRVLRSLRPSRHCSFFKPSDGPPTTYGSCCILLVIHKQRGKFLGKLGKFFSRPATPTEIRSESHPKQSCCPICLAYIGLHSEHGHLVPTQAIHIIYSPPFGFSTQINNGVYQGRQIHKEKIFARNQNDKPLRQNPFLLENVINPGTPYTAPALQSFSLIFPALQLHTEVRFERDRFSCSHPPRCNVVAFGPSGFSLSSTGLA